MTNSRLAIGADDAGFGLKGIIEEYLDEMGVPYDDLGVDDPSSGSGSEPVDYPDVAKAVAYGIRDGRYDRGILICGTGIGMSITANKVPGVRAAQAHDIYSAERARKSNDAQVLAMGARVIGPELAKSVVKAWLGADFGGGASTRKLAKVDAVEAHGRS